MQVKAGKYNFVITENPSIYNGEKIGTFFKIGGMTDNCVNISVEIKNNIAVSASMPYAMYDEQCSFIEPLGRGDGSIIMIRTLLSHIKKMFPELREVKFDDMSSIECATEEDFQRNRSKIRNSGSTLVPMPLYYLSIAYNGETWYEKYFNAVQEDITKHTIYKEKVNKMLNEPDEKPEFVNFLRLSKAPISIATELEEYYLKSSSYHEFFHLIPKANRCRLLRPWIKEFMGYYLKGVFSSNNWDIPLSTAGGSKTKKKNRKNKKSKRKFYCPKGFIQNANIHYNIGCNDNDF